MLQVLRIPRGGFFCGVREDKLAAWILSGCLTKVSWMLHFICLCTSRYPGKTSGVPMEIITAAGKRSAWVTETLSAGTGVLLLYETFMDSAATYICIAPLWLTVHPHLLVPIPLHHDFLTIYTPKVLSISSSPNIRSSLRLCTCSSWLVLPSLIVKAKSHHTPVSLLRAFSCSVKLHWCTQVYL